MAPRKLPTRNHLLARGPLAERANAFLGKAWQRGWLRQPDLDPQALWALAAKPYGARAQAAEHGGRSAEDVADFRERLARMIAAIEAEADLNPLGRAMAEAQLHAPGYTLRGGTNEILRGIVALGLGLR